MSRERLPLIDSAGTKTTANPPLSSPALRQAHHRKRSHHSTPSSSVQPQQGPTLLSDTTMTPWGGMALSESSFTSIPPPPPPRPPPPPPPAPPAPQPTPATPHRRRKDEDQQVSSSTLSSDAPSPSAAASQECAGAGVRGSRAKRRVLPQRRVLRPPRLPPLRPITNLSFSRSFTFSFFELPLHQSPRCRAERIRNLMLLLRQIHY